MECQCTVRKCKFSWSVFINCRGFVYIRGKNDICHTEFTRIDRMLFLFLPLRPASHRNCTTDACALHWRVGQWTQCTATCGRHGFQSRHVTCVHRRSGKPAREFHCSWRPRPASWQRCNIVSCGRGKTHPVIQVQHWKGQSKFPEQQWGSNDE